jgi:hypothetical protein
MKKKICAALILAPFSRNHEAEEKTLVLLLNTMDLFGNANIRFDASYRASLAIFLTKALQNRVLFSGCCSETEVSEQR